MGDVLEEGEGDGNLALDVISGEVDGWGRRGSWRR